jgi:hypothetical protein
VGRSDEDQGIGNLPGDLVEEFIRQRLHRVIVPSGGLVPVGTLRDACS